MKKKHNKGIYIVIGLLIALLIILMILTAILFFHKEDKKEKRIKNDESSEIAYPVTNISSALSDYEVANTTETSIHDGCSIIIDGFKVTVSSDYECYYHDDIGPVIYLNDQFQMRLGVRNDSYETAMKNPDSLMEKTIAAGGEITQDIQEAEINGKKYAYFRMSLYDVETFVVFTQASDTKQQLAGQIALESDQLTDAFLLDVFADIASTAMSTEEPNSTREDIIQQIISADIGERKEHSTLSLENEIEITYNIPENFYLQYQYDSDSYVTETFTTSDYSVSADCSLCLTEAFGNAEEYITYSIDSLNESSDYNQTNEIQTMKLNGKEYYYVETQYSYAGSTYQKIYAACNVTDSVIYTVEASVIDEDRISIDTIQRFLEIE